MLDQSLSAIPSSLWSSFTSCFTPAVLFLLLHLMIATIAIISSLTRHHHPPLPPPSHDHVSIARSPSIIQRLKSINFYRSFHEPPISALLHKPSADYSHLSANHNPPEDPNNTTTTTTTTTNNNNNNNNNNDDDDDYGGDGSGGGDYFIHEQNQQVDAQFDGFNPQTNEEENGHEFQTMDEIYSKLKGVQFGRTKSDREPGSTRNPPRIRKSASMKPTAAAFGRSKGTGCVEARRPAAAREKVLAKVTDGDEEVDSKADDFINKFRQQLKIQRLDSILKYKDKIRAGFGGR